MMKKLLFSSAFFALTTMSLHAQNNLNYVGINWNFDSSSGFSSYWTRNGTNSWSRVNSNADHNSGHLVSIYSPSQNYNTNIIGSTANYAEANPDIFVSSLTGQAEGTQFVLVGEYFSPVGEDNCNLVIFGTNSEYDTFITGDDMSLVWGPNNFVKLPYLTINMVGRNSINNFEYDLTNLKNSVTSNNLARFVFRHQPINNAESRIIIDNVRFGIITPTASVYYPTSGEFTIFPNPTAEFLQINPNISTSILSIDIFNFDGKLVKQLKAEKNINVSDLSSGTYILNIHTDKGISTSKFIKK